MSLLSSFVTLSRIYTFSLYVPFQISNPHTPNSPKSWLSPISSSSSSLQPRPFPFLNQLTKLHLPLPLLAMAFSYLTLSIKVPSFPQIALISLASPIDWSLLSPFSTTALRRLSLRRFLWGFNRMSSWSRPLVLSLPMVIPSLVMLGMGLSLLVF